MMDWTAVASLVCLSIVAPLCICGVFCNAYRDNWLQFCGLWLIAAWAISRIEVIAERGYTDPLNLALHAGLAAYFVGTAIKVVKFSRPGSCDPKDAGQLPEVARRMWPHVGGGRRE